MSSSGKKRVGVSNRGFAAMSEETQRSIASKGGKAAHAKGTAHEFTPAEAQIAGKKGGTAVSRDKEHMARIGRLGGLSRQGKRRLEVVRPSEPTLLSGEPLSAAVGEEEGLD